MTAGIIVLVLIFSAAACHLIARQRGSNPVFWGLMGAIFGPLAIPFAFVSKSRK